MSDTELLDLITVRIATGIVLGVDKEVPRRCAKETIAELEEEGTQGLLFTVAPCGRYAKGDKYKEEE